MPSTSCEEGASASGISAKQFMIDIKNRKLVLETAAKRLRQSGKTALARGLEDILRDGSNQAVNTPVEPAAEKQIVNLPSGGVISIEAPRLDDIPDYVSVNGEAVLLEKSIKAGINCLLTGPTSCGKTHLALWTAKKLGKEIFTIQGGAGATFERIVAKDKLIAPHGVTIQILQDALLPLTMRRGSILYVDEPNAIPTEVLFYLHSAMDDRKTMTYDDGTTLKAADGFVVIGAMNEGYRGTSLLNPAFRRRTPVVIQMDYLQPKREV